MYINVLLSFPLTLHATVHVCLLVLVTSSYQPMSRNEFGSLADLQNDNVHECNGMRGPELAKMRRCEFFVQNMLQDVAIS